MKKKKKTREIDDDLIGSVRYVGGPFNGTTQQKSANTLYDNQRINCPKRSCINGRWLSVSNHYELDKDKKGLFYKFVAMSIDPEDYNKIKETLAGEQK